MKIKNKSGFTLVEVLVAMSIISLISLAFYVTINTSIKGNAKNERDISILNVAQSEIEKIRKQIKDGNNDMYIYNDKPDYNNPTKEKIDYDVTKEYFLLNKNTSKTYYKVDITIPTPRVILDVDSLNKKKIHTVKINVGYENKNISKKEFSFEVKMFK